MRSVVHCVATQYATAGIIDPENWVDNRGGSNKNFFMNIVKELPKYGHLVRAFSTFPRSVTLNGVEYHPIEEIDKHGHPNVMWACYDTMPLSGRWGMLRIGSHHTYKIDRAAWEYIDIHTIPSQAALDFLKPVYSPHAQWVVQPNAVENDLIERKPVPGRVIYHTSWGRGLYLLLRVWPEIRLRVPDATLHIISAFPDRNQPFARGTENYIEAVRFRAFWQYLDTAVAAGGVTHMSNVPRAQVLQELSEASVFAFPCSIPYSAETFSVSAMECCKMGIPVVLAPEDALESIYKGSVLLTPAPAEQHLNEFADAVVQVLSDPVVAKRLSESGKKLAAPYTYENAGKVLSDIICSHTGFVPKTPVSQMAPVTPEVRVIQEVHSPSIPNLPTVKSKKLAFLLDPSDCGRPMDPERIDQDPRGLTGTDVTSFNLALEMGRRGHDVTWYTNLTHNFEARGIKFAKWERWDSESKQEWHAVVATLNPWGLEKANKGALRVLNQQINDFKKFPGWEQYTDVATALSLTHQRQLSKFTNFQNWQILPNGCDPSVYHEGSRDNKKLVWASSPDRGLHWLLELYPNLKNRVPGVEVHVYYMYAAEAANGTGETANRFRFMNRVLEKFKGKGVFFHGSVSRQEIAQVFSESRILAYPCDPTGFTEGFSCTTLEAAVSGCLPVIVGADALGEIYSDFVPTTPAPYPVHRAHYFENLVKYLTDDVAYRAAQTRAKEMAQTHNWQAIGQKLTDILKL